MANGQEPQPRRTPDGNWVPTPDPTTLTTEAVARAADVFRRELQALRETIETRLDGSDEDRGRLWQRIQELPGLYETFTGHLRSELIERDTHSREVIDQRLDDLDSSVDRRFTLVSNLPEQIKGDRARDLGALRELIEARLSGMDRATELVAVQVREIPSDIHRTLVSCRAEFAAADQGARELIQSQRELLEARLTAMDKAAELLAADMRMVPSTLEERLNGLRELIETRLSAVDKATELRLKAADDIPAQVTGQVSQLRALHEERFSSISGQFAERDVRTSQAQQASDQALNAALQAAKELVNAQGEASSAAAVKSETSFTKQIDQIGTIISTLEKALDARITELKERIDRGEGSQSGLLSAAGTSHYDASFEQTARLAAAANLRTQVSTAVAAFAVLISMVAIVVLILLHK